jgi:hypothetical protein
MDFPFRAGTTIAKPLPGIGVGTADGQGIQRFSEPSIMPTMGVNVMEICANSRRVVNPAPCSWHAPKYLAVLGFTAALHLMAAPPQTFALSLSPKSLTFSGTQGATDPPSQAVTFWKSGERTKSWTASSSVSWVSVSPSSGSFTTERDTINVAVKHAGVVPGQYNTSIMITVVGPKGGVRKTAIPVSPSVGPSSATSGFTTSPSNLAFTGTVGGPNTTGSILVSNTGTTSLTVIWSEAVSWLIDVQPGSTQTITAGQTATFATTASSAGLTAGTYSGTAIISGGGIAKQIPVSLTLSGSTVTPSIRLTPTNLTFTGTAGSTNPAPQTVTVTNPTGGTLTWTASDNASWLTLSVASGTTTTEIDTISATANLSGLTAGSYSGTITVTGTGATNSPQTIPVSLTVSENTATSATLTWTANTEPDLAGYKIYSGTQSGVYGVPISIGSVTSHVITNLTKGTTYFFTITACDSAGNESPPAPEASKSIFY